MFMLIKDCYISGFLCIKLKSLYLKIESAVSCLLLFSISLYNIVTKWMYRYVLLPSSMALVMAAHRVM